MVLTFTVVCGMKLGWGEHVDAPGLDPRIPLLKFALVSGTLNFNNKLKMNFKTSPRPLILCPRLNQFSYVVEEPSTVKCKYMDAGDNNPHSFIVIDN